jgi:hypothetical protein
MTLNLLVVLALSLICASMANAQATRTWVSGVGDDVNPCSRTAPCKTFAGAISKTANGGEIDALDPGGFGAVTITKSITIRGAGTMAGILASLVNGVIINATSNDTVYLDNIYINGVGNGLNGIRYLSAKSVFVTNCTIERFTQNGIDMSLNNTSGTLHVANSNFYNIGTTELDHAGVRMQTVTAGNARATINNSNFFKCRVGVHALERSLVQVSNSVITGDQTVGTPIGVQVTAATASSAFIEHCTLAHLQSGVRLVENAGGTVEGFINNSAVYDCSSAGLNVGPGAVCFTGVSNEFAKNGVDFSGTVTNQPQK